jgi:Predicted membrane protein (DUF2232).
VVKPLKTSNIIEWLLYLFAGMAVVFLSYYVPLLLFFLIFFSVPCAVLGYRYSVIEAVSFLAAMVVFLLLTGDLASLMPVLPSGLCGVVMGHMIKQKKPASDAVKNGFVAALLSLIGTLWLSTSLFRVNIIQEFVNSLPKMVDSSLAMYKSIGMGEQELNVMKSALNQVVYFIETSIPFDILIYAALSSIAGYLIVEFVLRKSDINRLKPFSLWKLPGSVTTVLALVYLIEVAFSSNHVIYLISFNMLLALVAAFTVEGYSLLVYFMKRNGIRAWLQAFVIILSLLIPVSSFLIAGAGILDAAFDFRHIKKRG